MGIVDYLISYTIIILSFVDKKKIPLQLVDKEKEWVIISTIKENNITIGYDYIEDPASNNDGKVENYLIKP